MPATVHPLPTAQEPTVPAERFKQFQFGTLAEQFDAAKLGMWLFLSTEVLFFGALFAAYGVYRGNHPELFHYGQYFLDWRLGSVNTAVLISSSLSAAWSVRFAQLGNRKGLIGTLVFTFVMAGVFMVVKYFEYTHKLHHGVMWGSHFAPTAAVLEELPEHLRGTPPAGAGIFFTIYFVMTGLHGIHVLVGMGLYLWLLRRAVAGHFSPRYYFPVDVVALYWHLVDMIWIFLFPLLYLIG